MTVVVGVIGICTHALESVLVVDRMNHEHMSVKRLESLLQASQCLFLKLWLQFHVVRIETI